MTLAQFLSGYIALNLMVAVAYLTLRLTRPGHPLNELKLHYRVLFGVLVLTVAQGLVRHSPSFQPAAKIWSSPSVKTFVEHYVDSKDSGYIALTPFKETSGVRAESVSLAIAFLAFIIIGFALFRMAKDVRGLVLIRKRAFLFRKIGQVSIFLSDCVSVPFSYWLPGAADVILPESLASKSSDFAMAIFHELQHHRQRDTIWVYALWALRIVCVMNPFAHLWVRWISEIQEFACDETLVDRKKVESRQYARCLLEAAQTALNHKRIPACATGLTFLVERNLLKRRVEKMIFRTTVGRKRSVAVSLLFVLTLMAATAYASKGVIQDRRVNLADAQAMAAVAQRGSDFPIVVNDLVLKQLNRYIGTPEGREYMRNALQRLENHRALVEAKLVEYGAPYELIAIPITESGYENLADRNKKGWGAGVWMFIKSTARHFGLRVDDEVDERLNVELETDAAMRLLLADKLRFKDWHLSILAYNMGETGVQQAIERTGSRDAWTLVRRGFQNDTDYLPKVMAAILILKNPESIR